MVPYFPRKIASNAIITYLVALAIVSVVFFRYIMLWGYIVLGITWVLGFFLLTEKWSVEWRHLPEKMYLKYLFQAAIIIRLVWVVASYFFYLSWTGIPFEFDAHDAMGYHEEAKWLAGSDWSMTWDYYFGSQFHGTSDVGYPLYLTIVYKIFGPVIIIPRIIKAFISAYTCVLLYKLTSRTIGEDMGRLAGIMSCLMLNFVIYCGYHLKETEMIFLEVLFLERADHLLRSAKLTFWKVLWPSLLALSLFFFRTVLGAAAGFALASGVLFSNAPAMKKGLRRAALVGWGILAVLVFGGGTIMTELESYWEDRGDNLSQRRYEQTMRGNQWAQYATGAVMAPMVFVLPFSTMVNVSQQYAQQAKHGGNYVRNFMGFFVLLALYEAVRRKQWRDLALPTSFVIAYLGVVSMSGFSSSERFLLPGMPMLIILWTYGITTLRKQTFKYLPYWYVVVVLMEVGWAYFKLSSRGLF
jgi:hypothetical protein